MSRRVHVLVPATSANLGPGFDSFGLALELHDAVDVSADFGARPPEPPRVEVTGIGAHDVPRDESHLVVRALRAAFDRLGRKPAAVSLRCHNRLPHGRGLGSSAAAIVAGVLAARALSGESADLAADLALAAELEGHPDNVAPCLLGGFTIAWTDAEQVARATSLPVHPEIRPVVCIPATPVSTDAARALLPEQVPHGDAAFNAARAALLVEGMTRRPELLFEATEDRLHQPYRDSAMPDTMALVRELRAHGLPAVVSGAGPAVLILAHPSQVGDVSAPARGWDVRALEVQTRGAVVETVAQT
ncbi:MAG: homoserine kinase [Jiangellaceae bacterium]